MWYMPSTFDLDILQRVGCFRCAWDLLNPRVLHFPGLLNRLACIPFSIQAAQIGTGNLLLYSNRHAGINLLGL